MEGTIIQHNKELAIIKKRDRDGMYWHLIPTISEGAMVHFIPHQEFEGIRFRTVGLIEDAARKFFHNDTLSIKGLETKSSIIAPMPCSNKNQ